LLIVILVLWKEKYDIFEIKPSHICLLALHIEDNLTHHMRFFNFLWCYFWCDCYLGRGCLL